MRMISGALLIVAASILLAAGLVMQEMGRVTGKFSGGSEPIAFLIAAVLGMIGIGLMINGSKEPPYRQG